MLVSRRNQSLAFGAHDARCGIPAGEDDALHSNGALDADRLDAAMLDSDTHADGGVGGEE